MNKKRDTLKRVAGVTAVVVLAPTSWTKPIVSSVILPVHAQTSTTLTLEEIEDIVIVGQQDDSDPRVTFILTPNSDSANFGYTFNVIRGSNISENTTFTLINNPTDGERIGDLRILDGVLIWNIRLSRLSSDFFDIFPVGTFLITIQAENPDGSQSLVSFNINFTS